MSFYTSLTGLNSAQAQLGVTSNNIANVSTTGFKRSRTDFGDIFATAPLQKAETNIGQGVTLKQVQQEFSQGNITTSGNVLDLAITGDGFFPMRSPDGLQDIYTRNGSFTLNLQNNVVNFAGQRLMVAEVDSSGRADLSQLKVLVVPPKTIGQAQQTSQIDMALNLPADSSVVTAAFNRASAASYNASTSMTVYDVAGNSYLATIYYTKVADATADTTDATTGVVTPGTPAEWEVYAFVGDTQVGTAGTPTATLNFNLQGQLVGLDATSGTWMTQQELDVAATAAGTTATQLGLVGAQQVVLPGGRGALNLALDFGQSTQLPTAFSVLGQFQDGKPEGELLELQIDPDGLVSANYSNGSQAALGKIALVNFNSPTGLRQLGDASYLATATSGAAKFGEAGSAGFGTIRSGALERANVDLTQELVDLITEQRNFQANAKAIETSSAMTQAIINVRS